MMSRRQSIYDFYDDKHCDEKHKIEMNCRIFIFALRIYTHYLLMEYFIAVY